MRQSLELIETTTGVERSSAYYLGDGISQLLPSYLKAHDFDEIFMVCGASIETLIAGPLLDHLATAGISVTVMALPEGERNKDWVALTSLCERLVSAGATKRSIVMAVGGGMISNLVGLASALLYRGIRYVEVPTTLLNLTDGTLSNKQAINGHSGKNQFGTYYGPLFVWADVNLLRTEPRRQWRSGLTEAVKNGLIFDAEWFEELRGLLDPGLVQVESNLLSVCERVIASKHRILAVDPSERGRAVILEYGHTVGHAVEFLCGDIPHGEAVGIGMCVAARLGVELGITDPVVLACQQEILREGLGSPTAIPSRCSPDEIVEVISTDNKRRSCEETRFILLDRIGEVHQDDDGDWETVVPDEVLKQVLSDCMDAR